MNANVIELSNAHSRTLALADTRRHLREAMRACQAAASGTPDPHRFLELGTLHSALADCCCAADALANQDRL